MPKDKSVDDLVKDLSKDIEDGIGKLIQKKQAEEAKVIEDYYRYLHLLTLKRKISPENGAILGFCSFVAYTQEMIDILFNSKLLNVQLIFLSRIPQSFSSLLKGEKAQNALKMEKRIFSAIDVGYIINYNSHKGRGPGVALNEENIIKNLELAVYSYWPAYYNSADFKGIISIASKAYAKNNITEQVADYTNTMKNIKAVFHLTGKNDILLTHIKILDTYMGAQLIRK